MINDIRHRSVELKAPFISLHPFDGRIVFIEGHSSFAVCCCSLSAEHRTIPERYPLKDSRRRPRDALLRWECVPHLEDWVYVDHIES